MARLRLPWSRPNLCPLDPYTPRDRRRSARRPIAFPLWLRLGHEVFLGQATDLSSGGIGLWCLTNPDTVPALHRALDAHERGALDVERGGSRFVARVRIAHVRPAPDGVQVGMIFDTPEEQARLLRWLDEQGTRTG